MAIIIPSKNIYGVENQKVRDNIINKVNCEITEISPSNEYDVIVYSEKISPKASVKEKEIVKTDVKLTGHSGITTYTTIDVAVISFEPFYAKNVEITIPKKKKNSFVEKIYTGYDAENNFQIKCSLSGDLSVGTATADVRYQDGTISISGDVTVKTNEVTPHSFTIQKEEVLDAKGNEVSYQIYGFDINLTKNELSKSNNDLFGYNIQEYEEYYKIVVSFLSSYKMIKMYGSTIYTGNGQSFEIGHPDNENGSNPFNNEGYAEIFNAKSIEFSINGDVIGISLEDKTYSENEEGKKPFTVSRNELTQYNNYSPISHMSRFRIADVYATLDGYTTEITPLEGFFADGGKMILYGDSAKHYEIYHKNGLIFVDASNSIGNVGDEISCYTSMPLRIANARNIISRYENGKETVSALLSISDYFYDYGPKAISASGETEKMTFDIGDIIVLNKRNEFGKDEPISRYVDGNAKQFEVASVNLVYDGATMQEITAQEVKQTN